MSPNRSTFTSVGREGMIEKTQEPFLGTLLTFYFLSWSMVTYLSVLYSIKYFLRGEKRIYFCVLSPMFPLGIWCPEQREALGEKTHVQVWGMAVCFGGRKSCQVPGTMNPAQRSANSWHFPRTEASRAPKSSPRLS